MSELLTAIPSVRECVVAVLRVHLVRPETMKKGKIRPAQFNVGLCGSGFCVAADKYILTAHHVLNEGKARDPNDKFYAFIVPQNADRAFHFPVVGFSVERSDVDIAILELGSCATAGRSIPAVPITFDQQPDGCRVMTLGFPSPQIVNVNVDAQGNYGGGEFFLKSHANTGIVSAQYLIGGIQLYELNIGWHHGESGGPIIALIDPPAAFSLMQHYRNVQSPHGIVQGPRRGCALSLVRNEIETLGIAAV
jgi:hypothetical protein